MTVFCAQLLRFILDGLLLVPELGELVLCDALEFCLESAADPDVLLGVASFTATAVAILAPEGVEIAEFLKVDEEDDRVLDILGEEVDPLIPSNFRRACAVFSSAAAYAVISKPSNCEVLVERSIWCAIAEGD